MTRSVFMQVLPTTFLLLALGGCEARGIGDPCIPESIPSDGFAPSEVYVETSSVQCRTRTCMVFRLDGNPSCETGVAGCVNPDAPVTDQNSADRVFCSCRCSATGDVNTPLCACTEGYHCVNVLTVGGVGVQGGYCVPTELCTADSDCGGLSGSCNLGTGVCNVM